MGAPTGEFSIALLLLLLRMLLCVHVCAVDAACLEVMLVRGLPGGTVDEADLSTRPRSQLRGTTILVDSTHADFQVNGICTMTCHLED